jgi:hypothetical protein
VRFVVILLLSTLVLVPIAFANDELPVSGILNPDFASDLAIVTTLNEAGEEGVFVITADGETAISMLREEIVAVSNELFGGFLVVYEESGQSLFELADGGYQMQLSTNNGPIDFSYLDQDSNIQAEERLSIEEDYLLAATEDGSYQLFLLTTGELSVVIESVERDAVYSVTFTGIPALNIKLEISAN